MYEYTRRFFIKSMLISIPTIFTSSRILLSSEAEEIKPFSFAQICDPQLGFDDYEHDLTTFRQAVEKINVLKPVFVFICGDLVNATDDKSFADFNEIKAKLTMPCYCTPGNHDIGNKPTAESLERYRKLIGKDYFSFNYGDYAFLVVNTQLWKESLEEESEKHDAWFKNELEASSKKARGIFVIGHYPLYLKKPDEEDEYFNLPIKKREELLTLFEKYGVVAMLAGHTHRTIINDYKGIQLVNVETTSRNFDERPLGFRIWKVDSQRPFKHVFVPL